MKLVDDWKQAWKWISTQCMAAAAIVQAVWLSIPEDIRAQAPSYLVASVTIGLLVLGVGGRLVKQGANDSAK